MTMNWGAIGDKVMATVIGAAVIAVGSAVWWAATWIGANVVLASDLESLAGMIAAEVRAEVRAELEPVKQQVAAAADLAQQNAADLRTQRVEQLRQSIRNLVVEIQAMEARRAEAAGDGAKWTASDETLLQIWREDLEDLQAEYNRIGGP